MIEVAEELNTYFEDFERLVKCPAGRRSAWLNSIRQNAFARFTETGFPSTKQEAWRFTNVAPVSRIPFERPVGKADGLTSSELASFTFEEEKCCQLVFVNGVFSDRLSSLTTLPRGARVRSLALALAKDRNRLEPYLTKLAGWEASPFTALNTAFLAEGAFVYLPPGTVLPEIIHLLFLSDARGHKMVTHPRILIIADRGCQVSIVESYAGREDGAYFTNAVTEIVAENDSIVDYHKIQRESGRAFHLSALHVLQQHNSRFTSNAISLGSALARNDINVVLNADGAECTLNGLYVTAENQHIDNHTTIDHARPNCSSREVYKGILDDHSTGVFNGKIIVRPNAQKTNAKQTNRNLLLSNDALVNSTPQLEIFADDVKCTHGATIGQLDDDELFYLRSRGIDENSARTILTYAFASEILSAVRIKPIQCQIDLVLLTRLTRLQSE